MGVIKSSIFFHKLYGIIAAIGFLIIIIFPKEKNLITLAAIITLITGAMVLAIAWIQNNELKVLIAKIIGEHEDLLAEAVNRVHEELIRKTAPSAMDKLRDNPQPFIQTKLTVLKEYFDSYNIKSSFVREILTAEFQKRLQTLLIPLRKPTFHEIEMMCHRPYPND